MISTRPLSEIDFHILGFAIGVWSFKATNQAIRRYGESTGLGIMLILTLAVMLAIYYEPGKRIASKPY